jgi:hypothetical protein
MKDLEVEDRLEAGERLERAQETVDQAVGILDNLVNNPKLCHMFDFSSSLPPIVEGVKEGR